MHTHRSEPHVIDPELKQLEHLELESHMYLLQMHIPVPHPEFTESESVQEIP